GLDLRLCRAECLFQRSESREFRFEGRALGLERLALHREVREPCAHIPTLSQEDREFIEPLPLPGLLRDRFAHEDQSFPVQLRERNGVELSQRLDLRVVERLEEPMALVRLPSEIVFQLLELPLVLREDERVRVDRGDLIVDSGEGFLRARLFLAQFPDQVGTVREPFQFARDSRHTLFQPPLVTERAERGLPGLSGAATDPRARPTTAPTVRASPRGPASPWSRPQGRPGVARRAPPAVCVLHPNLRVAVAMPGDDRALPPARRFRPPSPG